MAINFTDSPIKQAFCEIIFTPFSPWDISIPGLIFEQVKVEYPLKTPIPAWGISVQSAIQNAPPNNQLSHQTMSPERIILHDEGQRNALVLGPRYLQITRNAPYSNWEELRNRIEKASEAYCKAGNPQGIDNIALRYLNHIPMPVKDEEEQFLNRWFKYFVQGPELPDNPPIGNYLLAVQIPYEENKDILAVQLMSTNIPSPEGASLFLLDLMYHSNVPNRVDTSNLSAWLKTAHERIEAAFLGSLTDEMVERLEGKH